MTAPIPQNFGLRTLALATFVASLQAAVLLTAVSIYRLWWHGVQDPLGLVLTSLLVLLATIPLEWTEGKRSRQFIRWVCGVAGEYFPVHVIVTDPQALKKGQPYVVALEPHSALPLGIPIVFATESPLLPEAFRGALHGMASSVCFVVPLVRQLWWALGLRPVSRALLDKLLEEKKSVVLNPGGVQEILYMDHSSETVFLTQRKGFVRMAMRHGAPLVPVFVLGQSQAYSWFRPGPDGFVRWLSRQMGAVPLAIWGRWGTAIPHRTPMWVIIGKPIPVPHTQSPSQEEVTQHLQMFCDEMKAMVARHKAACGMPGLELRLM